MSRPKILITDPFPEDKIEELKTFADVDVRSDLSGEDKVDELAAAIAPYHGLVIRGATKVKASVIATAENLTFVARLGVSVSNVDVQAAKEKGIEVINSAETPEIAASVSELVFAGLGALVRNIPKADTETKKGRWAKKECKGVLLSGLLYGKTMGVIGFGRIGRMVAEKAKAYHMNVVAYDVNPPAKPPEGVAFLSIDDLLSDADVVSLHVPSIKGPGGTENLLSAERISRCKEGAVLVNTSRAAVWDEKAVVEALASGKLGGAVVDVFSHEHEGSPSLTRYQSVADNVVLTPHIGSQTVGTQEASANHLLEKIKEVLASKTDYS